MGVTYNTKKKKFRGAKNDAHRIQDDSYLDLLGPGSGRRDHLYDQMYITTKVLAFVGRYCVHKFLLLFR